MNKNYRNLNKKWMMNLLIGIKRNENLLKINKQLKYELLKSIYNYYKIIFYSVFKHI